MPADSFEAIGNASSIPLPGHRLGTRPAPRPASRGLAASIIMRVMELHDPALTAKADISEDDVDTCIRVLRAIEADRSHLTRIGRELRRELLTLAGLVAKPDRHDLVRMAKAFRRAEREAAKAHDRQL